MGLVKHTIAFGSSLFDMGSDFVNSLSLFGYFNSQNKISSAFNYSYSGANSTNTIIGISNETITSILSQEHPIWGSLSLLLIFMPGFVFFFPFLISALGNKDWQSTIMFTLFILFFPFGFIGYQSYAIFATCCKREVTQFYQTTVTRMTSAEAAIESTGQLILQLFTVLNEYPSDLIQIVI